MRTTSSITSSTTPSITSSTTAVINVRAAARALLVLALLACSARADIVHYKDGRTLEGTITARTATEITVRTDFGSIVVPLSKVARIEEKLTLAEELKARRSAVPKGDAAALFELAMWARDAELPTESRALLLEVIALAPDHGLANEALGRVKVEDRWLDPGEVDAWVKAREEEQRAAGLLWDEGSWKPEAEVMLRRGFVRVHGEWVARRDGETTLLLEDLAATDIPVKATSGTHITLYSALPAETAEVLVHNLDNVVKDFLLRWPPDDAERQWVVGYDIPVLALPDVEAVGRLMDSEVLTGFGASAAFRKRFRASRGFSLDWPRPLIGLVAHGENLELAGDVDIGRMGLASHQLAHVLVQRFKGRARTPGWVQAGLAAFYEGAITHHSTITVTSFARNSLDEPVDPFVRGWEDFMHWHENLAEPGMASEAGSLVSVLSQPVEGMDSREIGISWSLLRFLMEERPAELLAYVRAYDRTEDAQALQGPGLHEAAWQAAFGEELDQVERAWESWIDQQPPMLLPPRLLSRR